MKVRRIDVNRDPLFPGVMRGVWVDATNTLATPPTPSPPTPDLPFQLVPEMPVPPSDPEAEKKWQTALRIADVVVDRLSREKDFDPDLLHKVVKNMIEGKFDTDDIVALYHHRKQKGRADG